MKEEVGIMVDCGYIVNDPPPKFIIIHNDYMDSHGTGRPGWLNELGSWIT